MAGLRAASRGVAPDKRATAVLRACLDVVERLAQMPTIRGADVGIAIDVAEQAAVELRSDPAAAQAVLAALRTAIGRLRVVRAELPD